jgi:hypothetical protein
MVARVNWSSSEKQGGKNVVYTLEGAKTPESIIRNIHHLAMRFVKINNQECRSHTCGDYVFVLYKSGKCWYRKKETDKSDMVKTYARMGRPVRAASMASGPRLPMAEA